MNIHYMVYAFVLTIIFSVSDCRYKLEKGFEKEAHDCFKKLETFVKKDDEGEEDKDKCTPCVCEYLKRTLEEKLEGQPIIKEMFCSPGKSCSFSLKISLPAKS